MANEPLDSVLCHIRKLVAAETASDRELLERFAARREEAAFAALVQRHGPMVLHVCRRVLANVHDAEDACQAAFLVLARTAGSIRKRGSLASWLHGVALRTALALRRQIRRRQAHEARAAERAKPERGEPSWREVSQVLDEELQRLPESLRAALILCYLEGLTRDEAAHKLGWTVGALRGRLERGREQLRRRLGRRGLTLPAALLAVLLTEQAASSALPAALAVTLVRSALPPTTGAAVGAALVSPRAAALVEGVLKTMTLSKLKLAVVILLTLGLAGLGTGLLAERLLSAQEAAEPQDRSVAQRREHDETERPRRQEEPPAALSERAAASPEEARRQAQSRLNLKDIALAMHNFNDSYTHLPPPAIYSGAGGNPGGAMPGFPGMAGMPGMPGMPGMGGPGGMPGMPGGRPGQGKGPGGGSRPPGGVPPGMAGGAGAGGPGMMPGAGGGPGGFQGKALLSWRVALLPFLGEGKLYNQFHLNEPWDSSHNKKLLAKMPKVFAPPGRKPKEPYATYYQVFVGPGAIFQKHEAGRIPASIPDGTSNTLMIVEAGHPVPWTKPEDLPFEAEEPLPELGGLFPDLFHAACADGAVYAFSKKWGGDSLREAITAAGGEVVDMERYRVPVTPREAALREKNSKLKEDLERESAELEALRRDLALLREMNDDAATARLRKENDELEKALGKTQDEVRRLKKTIAEMKRDTKKDKKPRPDDE